MRYTTSPIAHLHDVLHEWCPAGQLIGLLAHALLPVQLLSSAEGGLMVERIGNEGLAKQRKMRRRRQQRPSVGSYVCDDGNAQMSHIGDDLAVFRWNLSVLDQLVQVLLCNA